MPGPKSGIFFKSRSSILGSEKLCFSSNSTHSRRKSANCYNKTNANKKFMLHNKLLNTFQGFIHQLDELFLSLKAEERFNSNGYIPEFTSYQDICDKLRLEVLIAIDKLAMTTFTGASYNEKNMEFLHKMNNLIYQLTDISCQYHNAIKDYDFEAEYDET